MLCNNIVFEISSFLGNLSFLIRSIAKTRRNRDDVFLIFFVMTKYDVIYSVVKTSAFGNQLIKTPSLDKTQGTISRRCFDQNKFLSAFKINNLNIFL